MESTGLQKSENACASQILRCAQDDNQTHSAATGKPRCPYQVSQGDRGKNACATAYQALAKAT